MISCLVSAVHYGIVYHHSLPDNIPVIMFDDLQLRIVPHGMQHRIGIEQRVSLS
jgi:hypothetical protein